MEQKNFFIRAEFCTGCGICQMACSLFKEKEVNPALARVNIKRMVMDGMMVPQICFNCKRPRCLEACRRKAIVKDAETGWVTIDKEKCNDCRLCIAACPFSAISMSPQKKVLLCDVCEGNPRCAALCPTGAIQFSSRNQGAAGSTDKSAVNIWK